MIVVEAAVPKGCFEASKKHTIHAESTKKGLTCPSGGAMMTTDYKASRAAFPLSRDGGLRRDGERESAHFQ